MNSLSLLELISFVTAFQLFLLALVVLGYPKGKRSSHRLLAAFMVANGILILNFVLFGAKILSFHQMPVVFFLGNASYLLLSPFLYLYTRSLCYSDFKIKTRHIFHLLPFILMATFLIIQYQIRLASLATPSSDGIPATTLSVRLIYSGGLHSQILVYIVFTLAALHQYRQRLKGLFSSLERINLSWLLMLIFSFVIMWLMDLSNFVIGLLHQPLARLQNLLMFLSLGINFGFATIIVYKGLKYPEFFAGIKEKPKYAQSRLTREASEKYLQRLENFMQGNKPYLDPSLSLNRLARCLKIPSRDLSQVINNLLQQNFFDYVNYYRIEEAKRLLASSDLNRKTILEILYEVGFNSKSVFNSAFKKHTGMTPTEYKRSIQ
ncbi:MAG: helix-turn-helix domain-containing protein [candidate division KSB1 bacterium]|nr:helix-turn-helix domain-containing protein [candidate division KSB1 bacterium]MDZ7341260.1 helix-turn-helix domain-containing protein [candidate division KSB1 bacterium]